MSTAAQQFEQERDDHGRFGSGGGGTGGGLPRGNTTAQTEGGGRFEKGTAKEGQVTWAHEKAKEQGKSVYMAPNPKHDPANPKAGDGGPFKLSYKPPKGEHHEVKPDGSMIYHPAPAKAPRGGEGAPKGTVLHSREEHDAADADYARALAATRPRIAFARAIEASVDGEAPEAARLWRAGWNKTDKGDLNFTPRSAKLVLAAYAERGNPLAWYYEHEDRLPLAERGGSPMRGVCSAPSSEIAIRDSDTGPECWSERIAWTPEAKRQIVTGERRQLSPIAAFDQDTREIVEILNVSLCAEGATHNGTILASRLGKDQRSMDDMIQQLLDAINGGDFEAAENIVQQMEGMDGGADMAKMARGMMAKMAKVPPPPPPEAPPVATRRLAASRADLTAPRVSVEAFDRAVANMEEATKRATDAAKRSDKATVVVALSRARDDGLGVDAVDEREHIAMANPEATDRFLASLRRKAKEGILVASRDGKSATIAAARPEVVEGTRPEGRDPNDDLTLAEKLSIESFNRGKKPEMQITAADFLSSKRGQQTRPEPKGAPGGVA